MSKFNYTQIEKKWQKYWKDSQYFEPKISNKLPKKYILSMFPYPSGNLHMGHVRNYVLGDALSRFYRRKGFNVLHPFGWDAFGLPAENAAIKNQIHPKDWTYKNIKKMNPQLKQLGISFAWDYQCITSDEEYTKWEQYIFIKMWEKGLVYRKKALLNWCEQDQTVLANEQVEDGKCWRCDKLVVQKEMEQYYLKIRNYAEELQNDLDKLKDHWPEKVLLMQKNWIGYEKGFLAKFKLQNKIKNFKSDLEVFVKNFDEVKNMEFIVISANHPLIKELINKKMLSKTDISKLESIKNRAQSKDFSNKLSLMLPLEVTCSYNDMIYEIYVSDFATLGKIDKTILVNTSKLKSYEEFAVANNIKPLEIKNIRYKDNIKLKKASEINLQDWGISRQRYWGSPIPMIHCKVCGIVPEKIENLPVKLPRKVKFTGQGNPLLTNKSWIKTKCPKCDGIAERETDTFDTFFESSWYFLRYTTPPEERSNSLFSKKQLKYWNSVDEYIGGVEHAILHLLYARFFTKVLADLKMISFREPFNNLLTQGMVLKDGFKMSKSKGNVVSPVETISQYNADTLRLFILFAAPPEKELEWNFSGIEGCSKFIRRLIEKSNLIKNKNVDFKNINLSLLSKEEKLARKKLYEALIKQESIYTDRKNGYSFNTLIAWSMEVLNNYEKIEDEKLILEMFYVLLNVLEPFIPHLSWELSSKYFDLENLKDFTIDQKALSQDTIVYPVTINGKMRAQIEIEVSNNNKDFVMEQAKKTVSKWLKDKLIIKEIFVPNKIINIVIKN
ncbi:class I tRNA ligase family protein [Mycoplasmopsis lipofaciens]|uniref:class I tRNA ligase family protein n=1 Tax=Mycoplasmopsis lipofaciens TaxID=114884 RepID=UPI0004890B52|nr:class I tRNA ligase family protein [Mycoplasmopsis lipofaciens]